MTRNSLVLLAAGGSFALLGGAFLFQLFGYPPCAMCLWQRWPHAAAIVIGALVLGLGLEGRIWPMLGAFAAAITGGIGVYHTGVERGLWEGPSSCTGSGLSAGDDLLSLDNVSVVMCDEVVWDLLGLSMASYNAVFSFTVMVLWILAARR